MRLIDADALNLDYEVEMADDWKTAHEIANVVKYAPTVEAIPKAKLDEIVERLEKHIRYCELCHEEFKNESMSLIYEVQINSYKNAIEIVKEVGGMNEKVS